jgi:hypothetical protein
MKTLARSGGKCTGKGLWHCDMWGLRWWELRLNKTSFAGKQKGTKSSLRPGVRVKGQSQGHGQGYS